MGGGGGRTRGSRGGPGVFESHPAGSSQVRKDQDQGGARRRLDTQRSGTGRIRSAGRTCRFDRAGRALGAVVPLQLIAAPLARCSDTGHSLISPGPAEARAMRRRLVHFVARWLGLSCPCVRSRSFAGGQDPSAAARWPSLPAAAALGSKRATKPSSRPRLACLASSRAGRPSSGLVALGPPPAPLSGRHAVADRGISPAVAHWPPLHCLGRRAAPLPGGERSAINCSAVSLLPRALSGAGAAACLLLVARGASS